MPNLSHAILVVVVLQIKRMKQLEQEKDVLLQGMEMVEQARHWYHGQVLAVQDKMKAIGKGSLQHVHIQP